ncbi:MAG: hypothetical protein IJX70_05570, partial [Clostridia bacterium]|nr:hypothetical protein [Clostridia bacterium]
TGSTTVIDYVTAENTAKVNIPATSKDTHYENGNTYLYAALVNIKTTNYERDYAAVSYVVIDGVTHYSAFDAYKNVRNIREVAVKAYNDYSTTENAVIDGYTYKHQIAEGKWSCYSADQRKVIAKYDNALLRLDIDDGNVRNWAANDLALERPNSSKNDISIITDANLAQKVVNFAGIKDQADVFILPAKTLVDELKNGFSFEVMFKIDDEAQHWESEKAYTGIFDYYNGGGFGLGFYDDANNVENKVKLYI